MKAAIANVLTVLFLMAVTFLISACAPVIFPNRPIPVKMDIAGPIETTKEISFVNQQTQSKPTMIGKVDKQRYHADLQRWTDFIVSQLESELQKRGVRVNPRSDHTFNISVDRIHLFKWHVLTRCVVYVRVEKSDGTWSKTFMASYTQYYKTRLSNGVAYRAVVAILKDRGFRNTLSQ